MTVGQVVEHARNGELAQLGVVKQLDAVPTQDAAIAKIVSYINLGMIELYKKFNLKTEELVIELSGTRTIYTIDSANALGYLDRGITDYNGIYAAYDEEGKEYRVNDENDALSILTPSYNQLQIPNPVEGEAVYVIYNAAPTDIVAAAYADTLLLDVPLPPILLAPLLFYIGYRGHGSMDGNIQAENNTHLMRFKDACDEVKELGVLSQDGIESGVSLEEKGWV